jgi:hypothetical protein
MGSGQFTPDTTFLLACLTLKPDSNLQQLSQMPLAWDNILQLSLKHGVASLVYARLKASQGDAIPSEFMQELHGCVTSQKFHNQILSVEMNHISERFAVAQIPFMVFKGPPLALQLYGSIYTRPYGDIDFLIPPEHIIAASHMLIAEGYNRFDGPLPAALPDLGHHFAFLNASRIEIELHWAVAPAYLRFPLSFEQLRKEAVEVNILNKSLCTPSPENMLLILCMHGTKHGWVRLSWIYDIAAFVRIYHALDWSGILQRSSRMHCRRMLLVALVLAYDLFQFDLPDAVSKAIADDPHVLTLAKDVQRWLFAPLDSYYFEKHAYQIKVRDHFSDKYIYVKVKQPFLEDNAITQISRLPRADRGLFFLLWINRLVRKYAVRPLLRFGRR